MSTKLDHIQDQEWDGALLAVSGGVDSIVLLHLLVSSGSKVEVAYIDHSQRDDTKLDILAIKELTDRYNIKLHVSKLDLPADCSEQLARTERYRALIEIMKARRLEHLITAHHADDVLETAIINIIRGTGPRGISSLRHQPNGTWRPFLFDFQNHQYVTKQDILAYADLHKLKWHEDSTNQSSDYLRNRIRKLLKTSGQKDKKKFLDIVSKNITLTEQIDQAINQLELAVQEEVVEGERGDRDLGYKIELFKQLPEEVKDQFIHKKISQYGYDVNKQSVGRATDFVQTKTTGKILQLKGCVVKIEKGGVFRFQTTKNRS